MLVAPEAAFQTNVKSTETSVDSSAGLVSVGAAGAGGSSVVKSKAADQGLSPPVLEARTRQWYCVVWLNPETAREVELRPSWSMTRSLKPASVATCRS